MLSVRDAHCRHQEQRQATFPQGVCCTLRNSMNMARASVHAGTGALLLPARPLTPPPTSLATRLHGDTVQYCTLYRQYKRPTARSSGPPPHGLCATPTMSSPPHFSVPFLAAPGGCMRAHICKVHELAVARRRRAASEAGTRTGRTGGRGSRDPTSPARPEARPAIAGWWMRLLCFEKAARRERAVKELVLATATATMTNGRCLVLFLFLFLALCCFIQYTNDTPAPLGPCRESANQNDRQLTR